MKQNTNSFYILQVSDFHISEDSKNNADAALKAVTDKISEMNINIKYLIHTGDIINSKDINKKIEEEHKEELNSDQYDQYLDEIVKQRFNIAEEVMEKFEKNLDVMKKNIIICCGNHDKVRYKNKEKDAFKPFREFLEKVGSHTELTELYNLDDLKVLVLNTNISDDKKVTCVDCENLKNVLSVKVQEECYGEFYTYGANGNISGEDNKVIEAESEEEAYQVIKNDLGLKPVMTGIWPPKTKFVRAEIEKDLKVAELYYQYNDENIIYIINGDQAKNSIGISIEDKILDEYIINVQGVSIDIKECEIEKTKEKRYYASFSYKDTKYFLSGSMERTEFEDILKNLYFS